MNFMKPDQETRVVALQAAAQAGGDETAVLTRAQSYWNFLHHGHPLPQRGDVDAVAREILERNPDMQGPDDLNRLIMATYAAMPVARSHRCRATAEDGIGGLYECALDTDHAPVGVPHAHVTGDGVLFVAGEAPGR